MILVDTTVWIDFFANRSSKHVANLTHLLEHSEELCLCGIVLTEILQGIKNPYEHRKVQNMMNTLLFLEMTKETFVLAAEIYSSLRSRGITIRKTLDCLIAAVAIENKIPLLHHDRDFDPIAKYCGLIILS